MRSGHFRFVFLLFYLGAKRLSFFRVSFPWFFCFGFYVFNVALSWLLLGLWVKMTGDGNYKNSRNHRIVQFLALQ